jgi:hypothetical protein
MATFHPIRGQYDVDEGSPTEPTRVNVSFLFVSKERVGPAKGQDIASDAAFSHLRPIQDARDYWALLSGVHMSSGDTGRYTIDFGYTIGCGH